MGIYICNIRMILFVVVVFVVLVDIDRVAYFEGWVLGFE